MFNYLRSNCGIGCKTGFSEMLLCINEDPHGSFCKEFHRSDISAHATSSMTLFEVTWPQCLYFWHKIHGVSHKMWLLLELSVVYPYSSSWHSPPFNLIMSPWQWLLQFKHPLVRVPPNHVHCGVWSHYIGVKSFVCCFVNTWKESLWLTLTRFYFSFLFSLPCLQKCL